MKVKPEGSPGLYVHVPFCRSRCTYCDFHVAALRPGVVTDYVSALILEIQHHADAGFSPETIFIGGGTPSALSVEDWTRLLKCLSESFQSGLKEWTIEANPESIDEQKIEIALSLGVDRLSTGAQTFVETGLALLGRRHDAQRVHEVHDLFQKLGVPRTSLDLIVGWPGQAIDSVNTDLAAVKEIDPDHISLYHLSYEQGTWLHSMRERGGLKPIMDDTCIELSRAFLQGLQEQGFERYEVSNLYATGGASLHNLNYWERGEYLGVGSGAASFMEGLRWKNKPDVQKYISAGGSPEKVSIETPELLEVVTELIMLELRLIRGMNLNRFKTETGLDFHEICGESLHSFEKRGLLIQGENAIRASSEGFEVLDSVIVKFVEDAEERLNEGT